VKNESQLKVMGCADYLGVHDQKSSDRKSAIGSSVLSKQRSSDNLKSFDN
jgi:hypothetical protein